MGFLILIVIGALLGWLGSIILRRESQREVLLLIASGVAGSVVSGVLTGGASLLVALGAVQLLWSIIGGALAVALAGFIYTRAYG